MDLENSFRFAWAYRNTCVMAFLWGPNRCLGAVFWPFLFECHTWSSRTHGRSTSRSENEEGRKLLKTGTARLFGQRWKKRGSCDVSFFFAKYTNPKEVIWQQYRLYLDIAGYRILGGKHVLILGPESGKIWSVKKYHCQCTFLRCEASNSSVFFISLAISYKWNGKIVQFLETLHPGQKRFQFERPQHRQLTLISDFLDLVNFSEREEAILATNWIKGRLEGLKASEPCIQAQRWAIYRKYDCRCPACL